MKSLLLTFLIAPLLIGCQDTHLIKAKIAQSPKTFCNPVNLNYRFMKIDGGEGIREAADPVVVSFKDKYYLFASKSSGYWYSDDFTDWKHVFITDSVLPIEDYAPGLFIHKDHLYYVGSTHGKGMLYRSAAPETGEWEPVKEIWSYWDPAFYVEGDNLYMYYGCSPVDPIYAQVLDLNTLEERTVYQWNDGSKRFFGLLDRSYSETAIKKNMAGNGQANTTNCPAALISKEPG